MSPLAFSMRWFALIALASLTLLAGCERQYYQVGQFPKAEDVAKLEPLRTDKARTVSLLGSPSHVSNLNENLWYYISQTQDETVKFRSQKIQQVVLALVFNEQGLLTGADAYGLKDGAEVRPSRERTPTFGKNATLLQEILGSLGRFNPGEGFTPTL